MNRKAFSATFYTELTLSSQNLPDFCCIKIDTCYFLCNVINLEILYIFFFRFDKDVKQWKERGVGDIKILHHQAKNTFRVLLRRDQVHKIACNHYISQDQTLEPMQR